jgi:hypothetical protein
VLPCCKHVELFNHVAKVGAKGAEDDGEGPAARLKVEEELEERGKDAALATRKEGACFGDWLLQVLAQRREDAAEHFP